MSDATRKFAWKPTFTRDAGWIWLRRYWVPGLVIDLNVMYRDDAPRCLRHGGVFYLGCMGICSRAPLGANSCPAPRRVD